MRFAFLSWTALLLFAQGWSVLPVYADGTAVVLPVLADPGIPAAVHAEAVEHVAAALEASGYAVRSFAPEAEEAFIGCDDEGCAANAREATSAQVAVQVRLFHEPESPARAKELVLTLFPDPAGSFTGRALIEEGGMSAAAPRALRDAELERVQGAAGPSLVVSGTPEGADVYLDEDLVGRIRYRDFIQPGAYTLRVSADGYVTERRSIRIPDRPGHLERIAIALQPLDAGPDVPLLVTGITALGLGVAAGAVVITDLAIASQSEHAIRDGAAFATWSVLAVAGLISGPILLSVALSGSTDDGASAQLRFGTTGLHLQGSF